MRAKEFLIEYNRAVTLQRLGLPVFARFMKEPVAWRRRVTMNAANSDDFTAEQLQDYLIAQLETADPTANKQYVPWLARTYIRDEYPLEDVTSKLGPYLAKFYELTRRKKIPTPRNDINRYSNFGDFMGVVDEYPDPVKELTDRGQAKEIFRNDAVRIIQPEDQAAACYYGQGTRWCTAATGEHTTNYFDRYNQSGPMFILLPMKPRYAGEKYQMHFESNQYMDEGDDPVSPFFLIAERFGNLYDVFVKIDPLIRRWLVFMPDAEISPIMEKIKTAALQHAWDLVSDAEASNDYYYSWLRDQDYVYPEGSEEAGDIDWDRVAADGITYLDYDDDADRFMKSIKSGLLDFTTKDVKAAAVAISQDNNIDSPGINYLPEVMAHELREYSRVGYYLEVLAEWMENKLWVDVGSTRTRPTDVFIIGEKDPETGRPKLYPIEV